MVRNRSIVLAFVDKKKCFVLLLSAFTCACCSFRVTKSTCFLTNKKSQPLYIADSSCNSFSLCMSTAYFCDIVQLLLCFAAVGSRGCRHSPLLASSQGFDRSLPSWTCVPMVAVTEPTTANATLFNRSRKAWAFLGTSQVARNQHLPVYAQCHTEGRPEAYCALSFR